MLHLFKKRGWIKGRKPNCDQQLSGARLIISLRLIVFCQAFLLRGSAFRVAFSLEVGIRAVPAWLLGDNQDPTLCLRSFFVPVAWLAGFAAKSVREAGSFEGSCVEALAVRLLL